MINSNVMNFMERNNYTSKHKRLAKYLYRVASRKVKKMSINDYAIQTNVQIKNRKKIYLEERKAFYRVLNEFSK